MAGADWRSMIADQVAVTAADAREGRFGTAANQRMTRVAFSLAAHPFLLRAAQRRGISLSGYVRRATMAHVALDLGLDPIELFKLDAAIAPIGEGGDRWNPERDLDGALYGRWEVERGDPGDAEQPG